MFSVSTENVWSQQLEPRNHLAMNFRLLVQRQKSTASKHAVAYTWNRELTMPCKSLIICCKYCTMFYGLYQMAVYLSLLLSILWFVSERLIMFSKFLCTRLWLLARCCCSISTKKNSCGLLILIWSTTLVISFLLKSWTNRYQQT